MSTNLHPDFPVVTGNFVMTKGWRINLREEFNRRIEDGSLVLWRPELTFWINVWNNDGQATTDELLARLLADANPARREERLERCGALVRLSYVLVEEDADDAETEASSINGFVISAAGYVQISAYYETPPARTLACEIIASICADA